MMTWNFSFSNLSVCACFSTHLVSRQQSDEEKDSKRSLASADHDESHGSHLSESPTKSNSSLTLLHYPARLNNLFMSYLDSEKQCSHNTSFFLLQPTSFWRINLPMGSRSGEYRNLGILLVSWSISFGLPIFIFDSAQVYVKFKPCGTEPKESSNIPLDLFLQEPTTPTTG